MVSSTAIVQYIAVMALVTYAIRMLPLAVFQRKINSIFLKSFLFYVPYAVLAAMTVPAVFASTTFVWSAAIGFCVAAILSWYGAQLLPVALSACGAVYAVEWFFTSFC